MQTLKEKEPALFKALETRPTDKRLLAVLQTLVIKNGTTWDTDKPIDHYAAIQNNLSIRRSRFVQPPPADSLIDLDRLRRFIAWTEDTDNESLIDDLRLNLSVGLEITRYGSCAYREYQEAHTEWAPDTDELFEVFSHSYPIDAVSEIACDATELDDFEYSDSETDCDDIEFDSFDGDYNPSTGGIRSGLENMSCQLTELMDNTDWE